MTGADFFVALRWLHVVLAIVSVSGFIVRGVWMLVDSPLRETRFVRLAPHAVDTLLLLAGVTLAGMSQQYPFVADWLTAKVLALVAYIGLGLVALRFGPTRPVRAVAFIAAVAAFGYMLAVAFTRSSLPWA